MNVIITEGALDDRCMRSRSRYSLTGDHTESESGSVWGRSGTQTIDCVEWRSYSHTMASAEHDYYDEDIGP